VAITSIPYSKITSARGQQQSWRGGFFSTGAIAIHVGTQTYEVEFRGDRRATRARRPLWHMASADRPSPGFPRTVAPMDGRRPHRGWRAAGPPAHFDNLSDACHDWALMQGKGQGTHGRSVSVHVTVGL